MRIKIIGIIIFAFFLMLITGLFYLQIIKGPMYQRLSSKNRIRLITVETPRGRIFDRNGVLLVDNRISFDVGVFPRELKDKNKSIENLSRKLGIPQDELEAALKENFLTPSQPVKIISDIEKEKAIMLEQERLDLQGVLVEPRPRRHYVYGQSASHVLGYLGKINRKEFEAFKDYGYRISDYIGRAGIEKEYDNYLRGRDGGKQIEVDNRGYQVGILGIKEPVKGKDLYLTIDIELQKFIEELFEGARGAACVMDPQNGQILSLVSFPPFDPNIFVSGKDSRSIKELFIRNDYPMLNRVTNCTYPPGSVFKIITASSVLDKKKITAKTLLNCNGSYVLGNKVFKCWRKKGHGELAMRDAIKGSCNVFFYQAGRIAGVDDIANYSARYGLGQPTDIDLPDESSGIVPSRIWKALKKRRPWYEGETLNYAIGQGYLLVTPIQLIRALSCVASNGYLVKPYLVKRIENIDISRGEPRRINVSDSVLGIIKDGLIKVVNDEDGTGKKAAIKDVVVAGKTGTAQTSTDKTHAWFAGFAPAEKPRVAVLVFLEYGGKGGLGASTSAGKIFAKLQALNYI